MVGSSTDLRHEREKITHSPDAEHDQGKWYSDSSKNRVNLNTRPLLTRYDLPLQPGLIIDQTPQPGDEVDYGYPVGVTITRADSPSPGP